MKLLIERGAKVNAKSQAGTVPAVDAIRKGNLDCLALLIASGCSVNVECGRGLPLAMHAVCANEPLALAMILRRNPRCAMDKDWLGYALNQASEHSSRVMAHVLLTGGANVDYFEQSNVDRPLFTAIHFGHERLARYYLQEWGSASVNTVDSNLVTPLVLAALRNVPRVLRSVLRMGGTPRFDGELLWPPEPALGAACYWGDWEVCLMLLRAGCSVGTVGVWKGARDERGPHSEGTHCHDPLSAAVRRGSVELVERLLQENVRMKQLGSAVATSMTIEHFEQSTAQKVIAKLLFKKASQNSASEAPESGICDDRGESFPECQMTDGGMEVVGSKTDSTVGSKSTFLSWAIQELFQKIDNNVNPARWVSSRLVVQGVPPEKRLLSIAAMRGLTDHVRALLELGVDVNETDSSGVSSLMAASALGYVATAKVLLDAGANASLQTTDDNYFSPGYFDAHGKGMNAYLMAASAGHWKVCRLLAQHGADVDSVNEDGVNALFLFIRNVALQPISIYAYQKIIVELLALGTQVLCRHAVTGYSPLHEAVMTTIGRGADKFYMYRAGQEFEKIVAPLVEQGADVNCMDARGNTPLHLAASVPSDEILNILLENFMAQAHVENVEGETPLHIAAYWRYHTKCQSLQAYGGQVDSRDNLGRTPLMRAMTGPTLVGDQACMPSDHHCQPSSIIPAFVEWRADLEARSARGMTALHCAALSGQTYMCHALLAHGADMSAKTLKRRTALMLAAHEGHVAVAELLADRGADIDARDDHGRTALYLAAANGHAVCVSRLLQLGCDPSIPCCLTPTVRRTPLETARRRGHVDTVRLLSDMDCRRSVRGTSAVVIADRSHERTRRAPRDRVVGGSECVSLLCDA